MEKSRLNRDAFFKRGTIKLHSPDATRANNSNMTREAAAKMTEHANTRESLTKRFIDANTLFRKVLPGKGMVQIMLPSSPYGYGGVMVTAIEDSLTHGTTAENKDTIVPTKSLFEHDPLIQNEYYKQILASILAEEGTQLPRSDDDSPIFAYENTIVDISNAKQRLPRSIALPHAHVFKGGDWVDETTSASRRQYGFKLEQDILRDKNFFDRFFKKWEEQHPTKQGESPNPPEVYMRETVPFGYTIDCGVTRDESVDRQAQVLLDVASVHHFVYSAFAEEMIQEMDEKRSQRKQEFAENRDMTIIPRSLAETLLQQPSYRTYFHYRDYRLFVTISPIFLACVGALEAMDTAVDRNKEHENPFTEEEITTFLKSLTLRLNEILNPTDLREQP